MQLNNESDTFLITDPINIGGEGVILITVGHEAFISRARGKGRDEEKENKAQQQRCSDAEPISQSYYTLSQIKCDIWNKSGNADSKCKVLSVGLCHIRFQLYVQCCLFRLNLHSCLKKKRKIKNSLLIKSALPVVTQKVHTSPVMLRLPAAAKQ